MKTLINNHVHGSQMTTIDNNVFYVEPQSMSGYGLLPKFEISRLYPIVIEYIPRGGILGLIFSGRKKFSPSETQELHDYTLTDTSSDGTIQWKSLFPLRYFLGYHILGCCVRTERLDIMKVTHSINTGERVYRYEYDVSINAKVDPIRFYNTAKLEKSSEALESILKNRIKDAISSEINKRAGNVSFVINTKITDPNLDLAGYHIDSCRIQYSKNLY